jgi:hypothetical protein
MKIKSQKPLAEMRASVPDSYTLTPSERAPIDAAIAQVAALEQQARGMVQMLINIHELKGNWNYDRENGRLFRIPETPAAPAGETK